MNFFRGKSTYFDCVINCDLNYFAKALKSNVWRASSQLIIGIKLKITFLPSPGGDRCALAGSDSHLRSVCVDFE